MKPTAYYQALVQLFEENGVPANVEPMEAYMKNHFEYYGIKSPQRKLLLKAFIKENGIPEGEELKKLVELMWEDPHRELQYSAMEILEKRMRKLDDTFLPFFEQLILDKSWWDSVDWLAPNACGKLFLKYPDHRLPYTERWNQSENIWLQRSSILFQLKYRDQTDFELLKKYILNLIDSKEFFIQKAIGWALRQYGKYNPNAVIDFVKEQEANLAPLSRREAMKHLGK